MGEVRLKINGKEYAAEEGQTILEVAKENDIEIPTHCYHKKYRPAGTCRMCSVEIYPPGGEGNGKLDAACTHPVQDGLMVKTDTKRVRKARKLTAELMLARVPDSESVRELAKEVGVENTRFSSKHEDCTLCQLCIRACERAMGGDSIITLVGRGPNLEIATPYDLTAEGCKECGVCALVCPVDALEMIEIPNEK